MTNGVAQALRIERVEHELNARSRTAPQGRENGINLMRQERDDHDVKRRLLVQRIRHMNARPLAFHVDDRAVAPELVQTFRARPRDDGHTVAAYARQLKSERASDIADTNDSYAKGCCGCSD